MIEPSYRVNWVQRYRCQAACCRAMRVYYMALRARYQQQRIIRRELSHLYWQHRPYIPLPSSSVGEIPAPAVVHRQQLIQQLSEIQMAIACLRLGINGLQHALAKELVRSEPLHPPALVISPLRLVPSSRAQYVLASLCHDLDRGA
jgi:hypothetical protein